MITLTCSSVRREQLRAFAGRGVCCLAFLLAPVVGALNLISFAAASSTLRSDYNDVRRIVVSCEVELDAGARWRLSDRDVCDAARLALEDLANAKLGETVTRRPGWAMASDPDWREKCWRLHSVPLPGSCEPWQYVIVDSMTRFSVETADRVAPRMYQDPELLIVWIRARVLAGDWCRAGESAITLSWRPIYEIRGAINKEQLPVSSEFERRMRPQVPEIECFPNGTGADRLPEFIKGAYAHWFQPYLINLINRNANR